MALEEQFTTLSLRERLLLSQAVYEVGLADMQGVSDLVSNHPLTTREPGFFGPQACEAYYWELMSEIGLDRTTVPDSARAPHSQINLKLARSNWQERMKELRAEILAKENDFKRVIQEIEDIRAGRWDERILNDLQNEGKIARLPVPGSASESTPNTPEVRNLDSVAEEGELQPSHVNGTAQEDASPDIEMLDPSPLPSRPEPGVSVLQTEAAADPEEQTPVPSAVALVDDDVSPGQEQRDVTEDPNASPGTARGASPQEVQVAPTGLVSWIEEPPRDLPSASEMDVHPNIEIDEEEGPQDTFAEHEELRGQISMHEETESLADESDVLASVTQENESRPASIKPEDEDMDSAIEPKEQPAPAEGERQGRTTRSRAAKRKASELESPIEVTEPDRKRTRGRSDSVSEKHSVSITSRAGSARPSQTQNTTPNLKRFQIVISMLLNQIAAHKDGSIFQNPIRATEAPNYPNVVQRPMDLKTIRSRIRDGVITNLEEFQRDIYLMFANAIIFNQPGSEVYQMTKEMVKESEKDILDFVNTQELRKLI